MNYINRAIQEELGQIHAHPRGRLLVLTGARQCGKTTLAKETFVDYPVLSMDSPVEREIFDKMLPADWILQYPKAVIDEAQKLPSIFETIKACYDSNKDVRYVLLGSSQILLLKKTRETLAGRVAIRELYPFILPELMSAFGFPTNKKTRLIELLTQKNPASQMKALFPPNIAIGNGDANAKVSFEYMQKYGGMPAILDKDWSDDDRFEWLLDYHNTYLQRDLADLARLDRLEPFVRAQKAAALRTAQTINFSELARLSDVTSPTARQFMNYLKLSYQIILLPAWFKNPEKRLSKQPKLHFLDSGIRRAVIKKRGDVDGFEFESTVVSEIYKQCKTFRLPVELYHLRTVDGREIDLLIEREDGFIAVECKQTIRSSASDFRHFKDIEKILGKPLLLSLVVSNDIIPKEFIPSPNSGWNVAAHQLFS